MVFFGRSAEVMAAARFTAIGGRRGAAARRAVDVGGHQHVANKDTAKASLFAAGKKPCSRYQAPR